MASDQSAVVNLSDVHESIFHMECFLKILCQWSDLPEAGYLGLALLKDLENKLEVMTEIHG